jgi:hypothetical protein
MKKAMVLLLIGISLTTACTKRLINTASSVPIVPAQTGVLVVDNKVFTGSRVTLLALFEKTTLEQPKDSLVVYLVQLSRNRRFSKDFHSYETVGVFRFQTVGNYKGSWLRVGVSKNVSISKKVLPSQFVSVH